MPTGSVAFLFGTLLLQSLATLPTLYWTGLPLLIIALYRWLPRLAWPLLMLTLGFSWTLLHATALLSHSLAPELEGQDVRVTGTVSDIPQKREHGLRFQFEITSLTYQGQRYPSPGRILLSWYHQDITMTAGQLWQLTVRLKQPNGMMNPGGFDYEKWLFQQGIRAVGYVRTGEQHDNLLLSEHSGWLNINRLRQRLYSVIREVLVDDPNAAIIAALAIGERQGMSRQQWDLLTHTGTTHLMAISGLHIGLVAGFVLLLVRWSWCRCHTLLLLLPAQKAAAISALLAATGYAALAGFSIPTQRALIMLGVVLGAVILQRQVVASRVLALALLVVLILDPLSVLSAGFWLSFSAVAVIAYGMGGRIGNAGLWARWGRVHWVVFIGLIPLTGYLFSQFMATTPFANFIAVPYVGTLIVPLSLLGTLLASFLPEAGGGLLQAASWLLNILWHWLGWLEGLKEVQWLLPMPPLWSVICGLMAVVLLLAPRGVPGRWLGIIGLLPMFLATPEKPAPGEFWFTLLDVGQGLAAVVRTHQHTLVYDTGPRTSAQFDTGSAVVVPFLRQAGIRHLDRLIISHGDNDHSGGAAAILRAFPPDALLGIESTKFSLPNMEYCRAGQHWQWDGVEFRIIFPLTGTEFAPSQSENNRSCVLQITSSGGRVLLTGDIERPAEKILLNLPELDLKSDILLAPHHGSRTSSSHGFIRAISPEYVLFPVGYRNRYRFPYPQVVERYRQYNSQLLDSARHGAITFKLGVRKAAIEPISYRQEGRRYWHR